MINCTKSNKRKLAKCLGIKKNSSEGTRQNQPVTSGERRRIALKKKEGGDCFLKTQDSANLSKLNRI